MQFVDAAVSYRGLGAFSVSVCALRTVHSLGALELARQVSAHRGRAGG